MSAEREPQFLTRAIVDAIHEHQIETHGGAHGVRDENGLESAINQPRNVYYYEEGDACKIAAAYAFHIAESQAYIDGNKRTGVQAAFVFLEGCGIDTSRLPEDGTYEAVIKIATREMDRRGLAEYFRRALKVE